MDTDKFNNDTNSKTMWRTVKTLTNNNKQTPPRLLTHKDKVITSLKSICNIANDFYISKKILGIIFIIIVILLL